METKIESWTDRAACRGSDAVEFFPPDWEDRPEDMPHQRWTKTYPTLVAEAEVTAKIRYCDGCPVRRECLENNLPVQAGVFGGLSAREREGIRIGTFDPNLRKERKKAIPWARAEDCAKMIKVGWSPSEIAEDQGLTHRTVMMYLREYLAVRHGA